MEVQMATKPTQLKSYISGSWTQGQGENLKVFSPYNGSLIGEGPLASESQIREAISSASEAQKSWAQTPIKERTRVMFELRRILLAEQDEITHLKCSESGKTFPEGKAGLMKGIEVLEYALSLQNLDTGGRLEVSRGVSCEYRREPLGVVSCITPFNFPAMVPMWTLPITLTLGNAVIWKPSEKTPLTALKLADCFERAGLPKGLLSVVLGKKEAVEEICDNEQVQAISFVGSTNVAKSVYQRGTAHGKRVLALGGAKNHIVLLPDASEDISGVGISDSFTGCAGQRCMAASVLLAVGDVEGHILKIKERAQSLELGSTMGAIITKEQVDFLKGAIDDAVAAGAKVLLDGRESSMPSGLEGGYWIGPTILDHIKPGSIAATKELFGPIISIIRCKDISEAMKIQNSSEYGNACSVFTSSGPAAEKVVSMAQAGMVGVNVGVPVPREPFSFGGVSASKFGHGDITGSHSLDFWSNLKKVTVKWEKQNDNNWMS
jgi:malonate-semialdehyde dehydrogenase (acetylating)/methylmalonate-semialdehyde dehydrogenase